MMLGKENFLGALPWIAWRRISLRKSAPTRRLWRTLLLQSSQVLLSRVLDRNCSLPGREFEDSQSLPELPQLPQGSPTEAGLAFRRFAPAIWSVRQVSPSDLELLKRWRLFAFEYRLSFKQLQLVRRAHPPSRS
ncbi:hypothetical protein DY000_02022840 [Brassica cretica]|uniref:Uncharacterized protein n=1 Tax=Brassica cretica TaxID=69181 RepID=A0ABQ7EEV4_BRACR|nr:hypothetical protein DY000_02022840 [Brassica cretica]